MGIRVWAPAVTVFSALILTAACGGSVTASNLTGPSPAPGSQTPNPAPSPNPAPTPAPAPAGQAFPSLVGQWQASGTRIVFRNRQTGSSPGSFSCQGSLIVGTQSDGTFSGRVSTSGNGWNSDRFCTFSGSLSGEMQVPDGGAASARLDGRYGFYQCTFVSGDGVFSGSVTTDAITVQTTDILRCPENLDGGPGMATAEFERTVALSFVRR